VTPDLSVVIACYHERDALPHLFPRLDRLEATAAGRGISTEVVFVDDGSGDETLALLEAACDGRDDRRVIAHDTNRGFGAAMRTGFAAARGRVLVSYDADATYPVEDILTLHDRTVDADVAGATPFGSEGRADAHPFRVALSKTVANLYGLALRDRGRGVTVHTCAFRAYRREALAGVVNESDDFLAAAELLSRLLIRGAKVVEVPSRLVAREHGASKMKVVRTAFRHLVQIARVALRRPPFRPRTTPSAPRPRAPVARLRAWNEALNRDHPMRGIEHHPSAVIRGVEERRRREITRRLAPRPGDLVLDLGAEEGAYAARLRAAGARPVAVDIDAAVLAAGRRRHGLPAVAADVHALPFRDGAVPRVLLAEVLEHCPDPAAVLAETVRVTATDGRIAVTVPDDGRLLAIKAGLRALGLGGLLGRLPKGLAPGHLHVFSRDALVGLLGAAGRIRFFVRDARALAFLALIAPRREDR
jgi:dolichol-phosphate mannosyltransferase